MPGAKMWKLLEAAFGIFCSRAKLKGGCPSLGFVLFFSR